MFTVRKFILQLKINKRVSLNAKQSVKSPSLLGVVCLLLICSTAALLVNGCITHFPGNNYFPRHTLTNALLLILIYIGCKLQYGEKAAMTRALYEMNQYYFSMALVVLATTAVQFTPFSPIDSFLVQFNKPNQWYKTLIIWTHAHTQLHQVLTWVYASLSYEMIIIPLSLIVFKQTNLLREYYFLLLTSAWLGFSVYYFFPTTAPASLWPDVPFSSEQYATGLKFYQIHHYIKPTTLAGGMVAFPSFHIIWAWLCVYVTRQWPKLFKALCVYNLVLVASCILLGWHYCIDILGSIACLIICHYWLQKYVNPRHLIHLPNDIPPTPNTLEHANGY